MSKPKPRKYYPPKNVVHVTVYLTPEQLTGLKSLAEREYEKRVQRWNRQESDAVVPARVSVSDLIHNLVQRELLRDLRKDEGSTRAINEA
jgi:predicted transcriptional regulator